MNFFSKSSKVLKKKDIYKCPFFKRIPIKYTTLEDVKNTIDKLYKNKKYTHKRIWQVGMIMNVRLRILKNKKPKQYALANKYFNFLGKRTKLEEKERYKLSFERNTINT